MIAQSNPLANYLSHKSAIDAAVARVLASGWYILGREVSSFESEFAAAMSAAWSVGVASGTDAVELALRAAGVGPGDSVATVSHTAVATVSAIVRAGAHPLFVDIDPERFTMDPLSLEKLLADPLSNSLKAIIVVHLYGQPADMPALIKLAQQRGLIVIEDCAQAHGAMLNDKMVGCWGDFGCFSFYPTKNLGALGDGGAIVGLSPIACDRLKQLREYGWKARYVSDSVGVNSRLDELQAAILRAKLPYLSGENTRRRGIAVHYSELLANSAVILPRLFEGAQHVFHQYVIQSPNRDEMRERLREAGVATLVHYPLAVHQQLAFSASKFHPVSLENTEAAVSQILSLPMFPELADSEVEEVAYQVKKAAQ